MSDRQVPWAEAVLDDSNSDVYVVELAGPKVEWDFRDHPDYYDERGKRRDGHAAEKLVRPAFASVTLRARSPQEAKEQALASHPVCDKVVSAKKIG